MLRFIQKYLLSKAGFDLASELYFSITDFIINFKTFAK